MKKIATIIVTYNGEKWLNRCLESLQKSIVQTEIFVVDNCSTDSSISITESFPVKIEKLKQNTGFGFANNIALKEAFEKGFDYFFLVNQDVYIEENTIGQVVDFAEKHPDFGIIAPIQYDGKGENIDTNFQQYISQSKDKESYYETDFCNAAAWLVSRKCLEKVGYFSSHFPHYGEDRNFAERTIYHQFKIGILKNTKVLHDRFQSMPLEKAIKLGKIKLLTIFLNPNLSATESVKEGFKNALGISKFILKKHKKLKALPILIKEFLNLRKNKGYWESEKLKQK